MLAIHKVFLRIFALFSEKFLTVGHFAIYQTKPRRTSHIGNDTPKNAFVSYYKRQRRSKPLRYHSFCRTVRPLSPCRNTGAV